MLQGVFCCTGWFLNQIFFKCLRHHLHSICDTVLINLYCSINEKHNFQSYLKQSMSQCWQELTLPPKKKNFSSYIKWILCLLVCSVTYCLWRCQSYISHLLTGSISRSRLTEQAFELYSLLLLGNETEMSVQLWRGSGRGAVWRASAFTPAAGGVSAAKHTDSLPRNTLFTSVSVQQGASGTGANRGWPEGATVTLIQLLPPATGPPFSGIFKLE